MNKTAPYVEGHNGTFQTELTAAVPSAFPDPVGYMRP